MLLPHVMRYNAAARPAQMARIATLLGEEVAGLSDAEAADRAIAAVLQLNANIGIPARLSDVGVEASDVAGIAETTFGVKRILRVNPQEVTVEGITSMLESAM